MCWCVYVAGAVNGLLTETHWPPQLTNVSLDMHTQLEQLLFSTKWHLPAGCTTHAGEKKYIPRRAAAGCSGGTSTAEQGGVFTGEPTAHESAFCISVTCSYICRDMPEVRHGVDSTKKHRFSFEVQKCQTFVSMCQHSTLSTTNN